MLKVCAVTLLLSYLGGPFIERQLSQSGLGGAEVDRGVALL